MGRMIVQPDEIRGAETQSADVVVSDADAVYACAKATGLRLPSIFGMKSTERGVLSAEIQKGNSGVSERMLHGRAQHAEGLLAVRNLSLLIKLIVRTTLDII